MGNGRPDQRRRRSGLGRYALVVGAVLAVLAAGLTAAHAADQIDDHFEGDAAARLVITGEGAYSGGFATNLLATSPVQAAWLAVTGPGWSSVGRALPRRATGQFCALGFHVRAPAVQPRIFMTVKVEAIDAGTWRYLALGTHQIPTGGRWQLTTSGTWVVAAADSPEVFLRISVHGPDDPGVEHRLYVDDLQYGCEFR